MNFNQRWNLHSLFSCLESMSDTVIKVENLSKKYIIRHQQAQQYTALRDVIADGVKSIGRRLTGGKQDSLLGSTKEEFWALKDVSFEVKQGDRVGIIGRNGAGKSTLLKILSRITEPTMGEITLNGRVASLLEVGTGFHPELTGRENIYLNGSILGMGKAEIIKKFDEIVDFAEVEKFLDTPVKHYSSGMYVRLAFAVAAHLEPEILIIDEILAVGDTQFQKKCLGKIEDVAANEGRTVLFVSHNMISIRELCQTCLWLDQGTLKKAGTATDTIKAYSLALGEKRIEGQFLTNLFEGDGRVKLLSYQVANQFGEAHPLPMTNEDILIRVRLDVLEAIKQCACGVSITNEHAVLMTCINTVEQGTVLPPFSAGEMDVEIELRDVKFLPGSYTASFWVMNPQGHIYVMAKNAITFEIGQSPIYGTREIDHRWGCVYTNVQFLVKNSISTKDL